MKKVVILFLSIFLLNLVSASCTLDASLVNQDPYPAVPNEYVKLVFQVTGLQDPDCKNVYFELVPSYPLILDPDSSTKVKIKGDTYLKDYSSHLQVPYKVRIDENALNGDAQIEVKFSSTTNPDFYISKQFDISIEDVRADFEIYVKNYDIATNTIEFEILNIGENDISALTVEIPSQENIDVRGANRNIVGDLDSNDYTTADFEAIAQNGEITLNLYYTDLIGVRREAQEIVSFEKAPFEKQASNQTSSSIGTYIIILLIIAGIVYYFYRRHKKKKQQAHIHHMQHSGK